MGDSNPSGDDGDATDPADPIEARLDRMDLREMAAQLVLLGVDEFDGDEIRDAADLGVGGFVFGGATPATTDPDEVAAGTERLQRRYLERAGHDVPAVFAIDALHGNATVDGAVVFPHNVGLGATRDPDLARDLGMATAASLERLGIHWNLAPTADILRDPRWGRYYEGFSEAAWLTGDMASASIRGLDRGGDARIGTCLKHFAGYSVPENGNDRSGANVSTRDLRTNVLPPFERALEECPDAVMVSSGTINGIPAHASRWLLETVLRERWGYDDLVVSDWEDLRNLERHYAFVASYPEAIEAGLTAGIDAFMLGEEPEGFVEDIADLVAADRVDVERIRRSARRVLRFKRERGLFEERVGHRVGVGQEDGRARRAAETAVAESVTLLENDGVLPLEDRRTVVVTGPAADSVEMQMGGWTLGWQGVGDGEAIDAAPAATTILDGLRGRVDGKTVVDHVPMQFSFDPGPGDHGYSFDEDDVASAVAGADAVVLALGEGPYAEWFGDRDEIRLPETQRDLVETVADAADAATALIGVVVAGRPRGRAETFDSLDAVVMAYLPGTAGGGVADVLLGETNPSGRLPFVWPAHVGRVPDYYNDVTEPRSVPETDRTVFERDVLYEFGHGLGYADFEYADLSLTPATVDSPTETPEVTAEATVTNTGPVPGDHVVEVCATPPDGATVMHPKRRLLAYDRIHLAPHETTTTSLGVPLHRLEVVPGDVLGHRQKVVERGTYTLRAGGRAVDLDIATTASISGQGPVGTEGAPGPRRH